MKKARKQSTQNKAARSGSQRQARFQQRQGSVSKEEVTLIREKVLDLISKRPQKSAKVLESWMSKGKKFRKVG